MVLFCDHPCRSYCELHNLKPLNTADFGKVMKRAFPGVKPRRLGQRGQSRYCYGGMRKRLEVPPPSLPDVSAFADPSRADPFGLRVRFDIFVLYNYNPI